MCEGTPIRCTKLAEVHSGLSEAKLAIWSAPHLARIVIILAIVLPEANLADLEPAALRKREIPATRARVLPAGHRRLHDGAAIKALRVLVEPAL